jgi:hypothetical protein
MIPLWWMHTQHLILFMEMSEKGVANLKVRFDISPALEAVNLFPLDMGAGKEH